MQIEAVKIDSHKAEALGLKKVEFAKLGQVVLIAGRNGSGKSRVLSLLSSEIPQAVNAVNRSEYLNNSIFENNSNISNNNTAIEYLNSQIVKESDSRKIAHLNKQIADYKGYTESYKNQINMYERELELATTIRFNGFGEVLSYVPSTLGLTDPNSFNKTELLRRAESVTEVGVKNLYNGTLAAIQVAQNRSYSATHQESVIPDADKAIIRRNYERLKEGIKLFLGVELLRDAEDNATLFGKPLGEVGLSNGQIILLQLCVALHEQEAALADSVLLLDEPENHLHPAALNEVLDRLQAVVTRGQIWIATHSINVLAHFDNPSIYYIENGTLSYAGDIPEKVLAGLLGDEEEREKLANFLALPFEMSSTRFAYESLLVPAVVMTEGNDPQLQQIQEAIRKVCNSQGKVRVLDFGAGRGRLIATIENMEPTKAAQRPATWLDYVAYDPYPANAAECEANIERVYGPTSNRYFSDLGPLRMRYHDGSFDIVLLTNVFHEIPPKEWNKTMRDIAQLLKPEGFLLIVEDQRLPHGERAHEYGFLLFDTLEFRRLFAIAAQDEEQGLYVVQAERGGRLKAHYFKRELLARMTPETKRLALLELQANAKREISRIRTQSEHSFKNGKLHALWMNQFANAQLALEEF
jgi:ABC-type multidrug transport system ATPase subunit